MPVHEGTLHYARSLHGSLEALYWLLMFSCPNSRRDVGFHACLLVDCPYKWMTTLHSYCCNCLTRINVKRILKLHNINSSQGGRLDCKQNLMRCQINITFMSVKVGVSRWTFISYYNTSTSFNVGNTFSHNSKVNAIVSYCGRARCVDSLLWVICREGDLDSSVTSASIWLTFAYSSKWCKTPSKYHDEH